MQPIFVIYKEDRDRWFPGDHLLRRVARRVLLPAPTHLSGMQRVVKNFLTGLTRERIYYRLNPMPWSVPSGAKVISFGLGQLGLEGLRSDARVIAAIGFPYPTDFPELCDRCDVRLFLQHSEWVLNWVKSSNVYRNIAFDLWHAGIDTDEWRPSTTEQMKDIDVLLYYKMLWEKERWNERLAEPIKKELRRRGLTIHQIEYGRYSPEQYKALLARSRALIFLSPHESQGFAYQEALAYGVPVMAWDPGYWLDPDKFKYGTEFVPSTSVPFFNERCGQVFKDEQEFALRFDEFYNLCRQMHYRPRQYVLDNLTIASSTRRMLDLYHKLED